MERDRGVIEVLNELVSRKPRWGFWKLHDRLRLDGHCINHKVIAPSGTGCSTGAQIATRRGHYGGLRDERIVDAEAPARELERG
jgi:hypothetical protein